MDSTSEITILATSFFLLIIEIILVSIYWKLNKYYELTGYEGLKYFKNSFMFLIFSFFFIYLLRIDQIKSVQIDNIKSLYLPPHVIIIIILHFLVVVLVLFLYNYIMTFFFEDIKRKHTKIYRILANDKKAIPLIAIFGLILFPFISLPILFVPLLFFYTMYKKTRQSSKVFSYFIVYNLLILSYTINLIQLIGYPIYHSIFIDLCVFLFQITLFLIIWKEVST